MSTRDLARLVGDSHHWGKKSCSRVNGLVKSPTKTDDFAKQKMLCGMHLGVRI